MPAQREEVVVWPDLRDAEQVREQAAQDLLARVRGAPRRGRGRRRCRRRQRGAVELSVWGQRKRGQRDDRRRHQVLRQRRREHTGQVADIAVGDHVRHQALVAGLVRTHDDGRIGHAGTPQQHRGDLPRLDPVTTQLDLVVGAARVLELPVVGPRREVAGAVHPFTRVTERGGHEPGRGERRPPPVAPGERDARHVQLARDTGWHRAEPLVQHVRPGVGERPADRHRTAGKHRPRFDAEVRAVDRGLGRAVRVDHQHVRVAVPPLAQRLRVQCLAADDERAGR